MREAVSASTDGAEHASPSSADSPALANPDDKPPIAEPPDVAIEKPSCPHTLTADHVAQKLQTNARHGLSHQEAVARLARDGPNAVKAAKGASLWELFLQQVANALTLVLVAVAGLSFGIKDYVEGGVVVSVILLNVAVGYVCRTIRRPRGRARFAAVLTRCARSRKD